METDHNKKESVWGYISFAIAIIAFVLFLSGYFMYVEMISILFFSISASLLGMFLGFVGMMISIFAKKTRIRLSLIGLLVNLAFIIFVVVMFATLMGGP